MLKDYLGYENERNKSHLHLYERLLKRAFPDSGIQVFIGHHLGFEFNGDLDTENEIPSADTLLFDHAIMTKIFGDRAVPIMMELAATPVEGRDMVAARHLEEVS